MLREAHRGFADKNPIHTPLVPNSNLSFGPAGPKDDALVLVLKRVMIRQAMNQVMFSPERAILVNPVNRSWQR